MPTRPATLLSLAALVLLALLAACDQSDFGDPGVEGWPEGPGTEEWGDDDLACDGDDDCGAGETCEAGLCQPRRCDDGPYESRAPVGPAYRVFRDAELLVVDGAASGGSYYLDAYLPHGAITYPSGGGSYPLGGVGVAVAAGNLAGERRERFAVAVGTRVEVLHPAGAPGTIQLGFTAAGLAAGDVDGDRVDELIAVGGAGKVAICRLGTGCDHYTFSGAIGVDVAAGDVDRDGVDEVVLLLEQNSRAQILVWNVDAETSGEVATWGAGFDTRFKAIDAGDLDGDRRAEIVALEDGGWLGLASDRVHVYRGETQLAGVVGASVSRASIDLAIGDVDGVAGDRAEVVVVGDNRRAEVFAWTGSALGARFAGDLGVTTTPRRIALGDFDGDSAVARLVDGPTLLAGKAIPTMVVHFPPHDARHAQGLPSVMLGRVGEVSEAYTDSVSLEASIEVGVEADLVGLFKAAVSSKLSTDLTISRTVATRRRTGERFLLRPQADIYGDQYGAVVMSCGCYHQYVYELDDPFDRLGSDGGADGGRFTVLVPVAGQTTIWSTPRYNALAEARGDLPTIAITPRIGAPSTYPSTPTRLDGAPLSRDELVFPELPVLRVSDVGDAGFQLSVGSAETNAANRRIGLDVAGSVSAAGFKLGGSVGVSVGTGFAVTIGEEAQFAGGAPPIPDRPGTPEDEYQVHGYAYSPVVYREAYQDADGNDAGYYVLTYTVSR